VRRVLWPGAPAPQGFSALFCHILRVPACLPQTARPRPQIPADHPQRQRTALLQGGARWRAVRRLAEQRLARRTLRKWEKGPHRYELQGPFRWGVPRASPGPSPWTGTGDAPDRSSRILRPRRPRHLASAAPLPASWAATVRIFVSGRSRSPRRECVRRVLWPGSPAPQGLCATFSDIPRFPACRPQPTPSWSTDRPGPSTGEPPICGRPAPKSRLRTRRPRRRPRPRAGADRHRTARRSAPPPAGRRESSRPARRSRGSR
jgi:hypothetical protein